jgi:hypothetical protein
MNCSRRRETTKEKRNQEPHGSAMLTTGSFEKPNPKGCATQFKSLSHPPKWQGGPHLRLADYKVVSYLNDALRRVKGGSELVALSIGQRLYASGCLGS